MNPWGAPSAEQLPEDARGIHLRLKGRGLGAPKPNFEAGSNSTSTSPPPLISLSKDARRSGGKRDGKAHKIRKAGKARKVHKAVRSSSSIRQHLASAPPQNARKHQSTSGRTTSSSLREQLTQSKVREITEGGSTGDECEHERAHGSARNDRDRNDESLERSIDISKSIANKARSILERVKEKLAISQPKSPQKAKLGKSTQASESLHLDTDDGTIVRLKRASVMKKEVELKLEMDQRILNIAEERERKLRVCIEAQDRIREKLNAMREMYNEGQAHIEILESNYARMIEVVRAGYESKIRQMTL